MKVAQRRKLSGLGSGASLRDKSLGIRNISQSHPMLTCMGGHGTRSDSHGG